MGIINTSSLPIKQSKEGLWSPRSPSNAVLRDDLPCTRVCGAWWSRDRQSVPEAGSSSEQRNFPDWLTGWGLLVNLWCSVLTYLENHVGRPITVVVETTLELEREREQSKYCWESLFWVQYSQVSQETDINMKTWSAELVISNFSKIPTNCESLYLFFRNWDQIWSK